MGCRCVLLVVWNFLGIQESCVITQCYAVFHTWREKLQTNFWILRLTNIYQLCSVSDLPSSPYWSSFSSWRHKISKWNPRRCGCSTLGYYSSLLYPRVECPQRLYCIYCLLLQSWRFRFNVCRSAFGNLLENPFQLLSTSFTYVAYQCDMTWPDLTRVTFHIALKLHFDNIQHRFPSDLNVDFVFPVLRVSWSRVTPQHEELCDNLEKINFVWIAT